MGFAIQLKVDREGNVGGCRLRARPRTIRSAKLHARKREDIDGALLTGTQVYANGTQNRFEGVFMNRTSFDSPMAKGVTVFDLRVLGTEIGIAGVTINKFFYQRRE